MFKGKGGYSIFLRRVSKLMIEGDVEGGVDENPTGAPWWQEAMEEMEARWGGEQVQELFIETTLQEMEVEVPQRRQGPSATVADRTAASPSHRRGWRTTRPVARS